MRVEGMHCNQPTNISVFVSNWQQWGENIGLSLQALKKLPELRNHSFSKQRFS